VVAAAACAPSASAPPPPMVQLDLPPRLAQPEAAPIAEEPAGCPPLRAPETWRGEPVAEVEASADDPLGGRFTLADATQGLPGGGKLIARISTSKGELRCELWHERAPITVANFVGLARGKRPWKQPEGQWRATPAYDGSSFHRIIKGFVLQGGDPKGNGKGEPGYVIPDELWEGARHDERGLLCMANRGKNTSGMQFFILDHAAPHLDSSYTIFGRCGPEEVLNALAAVPVEEPMSRPVEPPRIHHVRIERERPDGPCEP